MIFTIHFGVKIPLFLGSHPNVRSIEKNSPKSNIPGCEVAEACRREDEATHENHEATAEKTVVVPRVWVEIPYWMFPKIGGTPQNGW